MIKCVFISQGMILLNIFMGVDACVRVILLMIYAKVKQFIYLK